MAEVFNIDPSGEINALAYHSNVELSRDSGALDALAARLDTKLPEEPRVLLLNEGEIPHTPEAILIGPKGKLDVPTRESENDILVNLKPRNNLTEANITEGLARALLTRKREAQNQLAKRAGAGAIALSIVVLIGGHTAEVPYSEPAGFGLFAVGTALITYFSNRAKHPKLPDLSDARAPIRLTPKRTS